MGKSVQRWPEWLLSEWARSGSIRSLSELPQSLFLFAGKVTSASLDCDGDPGKVVVLSTSLRKTALQPASLSRGCF